jgi:pimeloyl-ACP methyl ester carboxylesterase
MISPHARRIALTAAAALVFLLLLGATYQGVATALERRQFPHPGRLIDIGDRQLHIYCTGEGSPVVVLEAPAAGLSVAWGWVQPAVSLTTRVCSYDRAGLGWSELGDASFDAGAVPQHLHTLLQRAGESGPFVIAGQGLGAAFASMYAARYASDVAGLILVDPPVPDPERDEGGRVRLVRASPWLARAGILRVTRLLAERTEGLPRGDAGALATFLNRPDHLTRAARELNAWDDTVRLASIPVDGSIPVARIQASGDNRLTFLTDRAVAEDVSAAIVNMVLRIRR